MEEKISERARAMLENFNALAPDIQDKLINAVKCVALLYSLTDDNDDTPREIPAQSAV